MLLLSTPKCFKRIDHLTFFWEQGAKPSQHRQQTVILSSSVILSCSIKTIGAGSLSPCKLIETEKSTMYEQSFKILKK